jgi:transglutaminase-like putative cysteine protease
MKILRNFGGVEIVIALLISAIAGGIVFYKIRVLDYTVASVQPEDGYFVRLTMSVTGNGKPLSVRVTLPLQSERQIIKSEREASGGKFTYTITPGRIGQWRANDLSGNQDITYSFFAQTKARSYALPQGGVIPKDYPDAVRDNLQPEERIQSDAPEITAKAAELAPDGTDLRTTIEKIYNFCYTQVKFLDVRGATDSITALKLGEASCNGKNRLMVALLRARGIPARMANGLILEPNRKRTTHAWTIAYVGDEWVPFCPTNGYFAEIPDQYLELARGDVAVFTHSPNIGFDWRFVIQRQLSHEEEVVYSNVSNPLNILHAWVGLKKEHISLELIMIVLMVPIGATVVALCRNVIGILPFGTFMPALIAVSFRDTGILIGAAFFLTVILVATGVNLLLMRLRLLHIPRLVIIISVVVMSITLLAVAAMHFGLQRAAGVSLFPMAILSLTSERFSQVLLQEDWKAAAKRMVSTFVVAAACYGVYNIKPLQTAIIAFPELLLVNISINLVLGSWTGLRLMEYLRFRELATVEPGSNEL